jgi:hypothetical protein
MLFISMLDVSVLVQYITDLKRIDPTTGITIKLLHNNSFELMYITVSKFLERVDVYKYEMERASKTLNNVESGLKKFYKNVTNDTLSFNMTNENEAHEKIAYLGYNGFESSYFRLFRQYQVTSPKEETDFKV